MLEICREQWGDIMPNLPLEEMIPTNNTGSRLQRVRLQRALGYNEQIFFASNWLQCYIVRLDEHPLITVSFAYFYSLQAGPSVPITVLLWIEQTRGQVLNSKLLLVPSNESYWQISEIDLFARSGRKQLAKGDKLFPRWLKWILLWLVVNKFRL